MRRSWWIYFAIALGLVFIVGIVGQFTFLGYYWHSVDANHIGIETIEGRVTSVLGPGIHSNGTLWADLNEVSLEQLDWCSVDPEVITSDRQRLGFVVCGTVSRPSQNDFVEGTTETFYEYRDNEFWTGYKRYYTSDQELAGEYHTEKSADGRDTTYIVDRAGLMDQLARQAMKSCVGDRTFDNAVVGGKRDELRTCIDEVVSTMAAGYGGLKVQNLTVPNVVLSAGVQEKFDEITQSRLDTELAKQNAQKEAALADQQLAVQTGQIRVEQGRVQELQRQAAITAELERAALEAKQAVITAEKSNQLLEAQKNLEIAEAKLAVARKEAEAMIAKDAALAALYAEHPEFLDMLIQKGWAEALAAAGAVYIPAGTDPTTIINPNGNPPQVVIPAQP